MNRKILMKLSVLAVCSALLFLLTPGNGGSILVLATMPFTLLGQGLRVLSLSGPAGNIAAIVIYVTVCLLPLVLILRKKKEKEEQARLEAEKAAASENAEAAGSRSPHLWP